MKRHIARALSLMVFPMLLLVSVPATHADTDVYFTGNLVADPCELHVDSEDQIVDFRNIPSKTFIKYHLSERERFSITGTAGGIAIAIEDADGTPVLPNTTMRPTALTTGDTNLNFQAFVSAPVHSRVREGDFECVTTFLLEYD